MSLVQPAEWRRIIKVIPLHIGPHAILTRLVQIPVFRVYRFRHVKELNHGTYQAVVGNIVFVHFRRT